MTNLMEIDQLIELFFQEREQGIKNLHSSFCQSKNQLSFRSLKEELTAELRTGCTSFFNKNYPIQELNNYLFYIANSYCQKLYQPIVKLKTEYICPACLYVGKDCYPLVFNRVFQCSECAEEAKTTSDPKRLLLFETFATHNKKGVHCSDCQRFIPVPLDSANNIVCCPYFDCAFTGNIQSLARMHHPTYKHNPERLILDTSSEKCFASLKEVIPSQEANIEFQLEIAEDLQEKVSQLKSIIETQSNAIPYNSINATVKHKQFVYQAFSNVLDQYPAEMTAYLLQTSSQHNGFQHKVFQEYVHLLEAALPFIVIKNKKPSKITSLLDSSLSLFDGVSTFEGIINDKLFIKNETQEFYIGGRKATYAKPYYIGKLLNVVEKHSKNSLISLVEEYSFSKIKMHDIEPETEVVVSHLRMVPHYESSGMSYVNRVRKKIVERAKEVIK